MPKFKVGNTVIFNLSYAKVLYIIEDISTYINAASGEKSYFYILKGIEVLKRLKKNKDMVLGKVNIVDHGLLGEVRRYNPYCSYFDDTAILYKPNSVKFIENL